MNVCKIKLLFKNFKIKLIFKQLLYIFKKLICIQKLPILRLELYKDNLSDKVLEFEEHDIT